MYVILTRSRPQGRWRALEQLQVKAETAAQKVENANARAQKYGLTSEYRYAFIGDVDQWKGA